MERVSDETRWRTVEDELPDEGKEVLCWNKHLGAFVGCYKGVDYFPNWVMKVFDDAFVRDVYSATLYGLEIPTHWRPMPKLPEE